MFNRLNIKTQNVNSMNLSSRSMGLTCPFLKKCSLIGLMKFDILLLQDLRLNGNEKLFNAQFNCSKYGNYQSVINSPTSSRGVAIMFNRDLGFDIRHTIKDREGNFIIVVGLLNEKPFCIASIYGPNNANVEFFSNLSKEIEPYKHFSCIIGGDFNTLINQNTVGNNIDIMNGINLPLPANGNALGKLVIDCNLMDAFRKIHPDKKLFSYSPFTGRTYASRIDNIFVSESLDGYLTEADIVPSLSKSFDHSTPSITLSSKSGSVFSLPSIDPNNTKFYGITPLLKLCCLETIINYADAPQELRILFENANLLFELNLTALKNFYISNSADKLLLNLIIARFNEINTALDGVNFSEIFSVQHFSIDPDVLLQVLCNEIVLRVSRTQKILRKAKFSRFHSRSIEMTKCLQKGQMEQAFQINDLIKSEVDERIKENIHNSKLFNILNQEKATASFCKIAKNLKSNKSISEIKKADGSAFKDHTERSKYINEFYQNIYKKKRLNGNINSFLGPIVNSIKKINLLEKIRLEQEISVDELNNAFIKANKKSAGGTDGMIFGVLSPIFYQINTLILRAFEKMIRNKRLSPPFCNVSIRLIP